MHVDDTPDFGQAALVEEFRVLAIRVADQRERAIRLRALADHAEAQAARDERILEDLEGALGVSPQMQIEDLDPRLRGRRLEEVALDLLRRSENANEPIHYREWFSRLRAHGHHVAGKDPFASFLSQLNRSDAVERVGQRTGLYRLRQAS